MRRAIAAFKAALAKARGERARVSARVSSDDEASVGRTDDDAPAQIEDSSHSRSSLQSAAKKAILLGGVVTKLKREQEPPVQSTEPASRGFAGMVHQLIKGLGHLSDEAGGGSL